MKKPNEAPQGIEIKVAEIKQAVYCWFLCPKCGLLAFYSKRAYLNHLRDLREGVFE